MLVLLLDCGVWLLCCCYLFFYFTCIQSGSWVCVCMLRLLAVLRAFLSLPSVLLVCDFTFSGIHICLEGFFSCLQSCSELCLDVAPPPQVLPV